MSGRGVLDTDAMSPWLHWLAIYVVATWLAVSASSTEAGLPGSVQVIAITGDAAPDGNGSLTGFSEPVLNDNGQVAFRGRLTETTGGVTDDRIVLLADGKSLIQIAREGQVATDGRRLGDPSTISLNESGQVSLLAGAGIYRGDATTPPTPVAFVGGSPPGGGTYFDLEIPDLNSAGQVAFRASLDPTSGSGGVLSGIYVGDGTATTEIVRSGQPTPNRDGEFFSISRSNLNNAGQAAFSAFLSNTSGGASNDRGVFRGDGTTLVEIVRENDPVPDGSGAFRLDDRIALNSAGQVAFRSRVFGPNGPVTASRGLFVGDGTTISQLVRRGDPAPDGNGVFSSFIGRLRLNETGQTAFHGYIRQTLSSSSSESGIFRVGPSPLEVVQIVREGEPALDGNGFLDQLLFTQLAFNDNGQMAITAKYVETAAGRADDRALLFHDDTFGLVQIARTGDSFLGDTITGLSFYSLDSFVGNEGDGLNAIGQVAYAFSLADGRSGIALFTPVPEPTSAALALVAVVGVGRPRSRWPAAVAVELVAAGRHQIARAEPWRP